MTLRQTAERFIQTECVSHAEWKALARELLLRGVFEDDASDSPTVLDALLLCDSGGESEHVRVIAPCPSND
jgi:hypothetical protein